MIEVPQELDDQRIAQVRASVNSATAGLSLAEAATRLRALADDESEPGHDVIVPVARTLVEQIEANRQDKLLMAGARGPGARPGVKARGRVKRRAERPFSRGSIAGLVPAPGAL